MNTQWCWGIQFWAIYCSQQIELSVSNTIQPKCTIYFHWNLYSTYNGTFLVFLFYKALSSKCKGNSVNLGSIAIQISVLYSLLLEKCAWLTTPSVQIQLQQFQNGSDNTPTFLLHSSLPSISLWITFLWCIIWELKYNLTSGLII